MNDLYIGLMSGTSADGIDAALVDFSDARPQLIATHYTSYSDTLRKQILALCYPGEDEIHRMGELDIQLAQSFAQATLALLEKQSINIERIKAIGSHGQTIRHSPHHPHPFTLQIGDPNTLAAETGITTVADFRRKDIAYGGQGAPLVPAFHHYAFADATKNRIIVNIGGIANITLLPQQDATSVLGFDTGPGNVLMDGWIHQHQQCSHDARGEWAAQGKINKELLVRLLSDHYFQAPPPKSTGREHFNLIWLNQHLQALEHGIDPVDVQTTLTELTAQTIMQAIQQTISSGEILICGGGVHNHFLVSRLKALTPKNFTLSSTASYGIAPDWVEAIAFAWLARQTLLHKPGNLPRVTGARQAAILGGIYYAR